MTAERETVRDNECQRIRDMVGLAQNLGQNHVLGPDLDRRTINVVRLAQNRGPDQGKGGKTMHEHNSRLSPPETRWSHGLQTRGDAGLDPAQEREGKKKDHHPRVHIKLQVPLFHPLKTQDSHRSRKRTWV